MGRKKNFTYTMIVVPAVAINGVISGIISVITAYFFKPIWSKIMKWIKYER